MNKFFVVTGFLLLGLFAQAQVPTSGNIFIGYSYSGGDVTVPSAPERLASSHTAGLNGWEGSLEGKILPWIGIVADLSGHYGSHNLTICSFVLPPCSTFQFNVRRYTFMFGPQVSVPIGKFSPFAHAFLGAAHVITSAITFPAAILRWPTQSAAGSTTSS